MKVLIELEVKHSDDQHLTKEMREAIIQDFSDCLEVSYSIDAFEDEAGDIHDFEFSIKSIKEV